MRRGEAGSTLIERPNNDPVPDFHECQGKGYTTTSVTPSLSHHGRPFEQETQKDVSLRLQMVPWNRE